MTVAGVILGFPGETRESAWETIHFVKELDPNDVGFYITSHILALPCMKMSKPTGS
jgi:tRNA A37 methylthiotransferase MiaB